MRSIPGWPTNTDVLEPVVRVVHGGLDREVESLSLSRELPSSMHAQVRGVGGITQTTGSVTWSARSDVAEAQPTAFGRIGNWPPKVRGAVGVYAGYRTATGDLLAKQLTGFISGSSGDPQEPTSSKLVDPIARLSRTVNLPPLLNNMPPLTEGGPWRGVGLYPTFFTDKAARAGGFNSTPGMTSGCVFSAPLMGSAWPERGTLFTGLRFTDRNNANARWHESPWGMAVSDCLLTYTPWSNSGLDVPMEISALATAPPFIGRTYVAARWGESEIRLNYNGSRAYGMVNGSVVCEIAVLPEGGVHTLRVVPSGSSVTLILRDSTGREVSATTAMPAGATSPLGEVWVVSEEPNAMIGGAQVSFPSTAWSAVSYTRSAFITPPAHYASLRASPPIQDVPARKLLDEQSTAELAALWIDGDGYLHWVNRNKLLSGSPATTLTSKDHLKSLPWEEDFAAVASMVEVTSRQAEAINQFKYPRQEVWRSNYSKADANGTEVFEELLHPDADEDWIMVDASFNNDYADAHDMRGSDVALYYFMEKGDQSEGTYSAVEGYDRAWAGATLQFIDHRTYKLTTTVYAVSAAAWDQYEFSLKIPSEHQSPSGGGWAANLGGMNFPVIRSFAKVMWTDRTYKATAGVWDAPVLTHDVGWWVQDPGACQAIADLLASETTTPRPVLNGVSIVPDARLERGDIVTLSDPDVTGIEFRCLVVGIDDTFRSGPLQWEQSCSFRVLDYTLVSTTLGDLDTVWAGQLLSALDTARANETLAQFDAQPLKGAPQ
ncbi:hypothetical protein [Arthrobacter burdickii]|uniref:Minor tail protein n=1 Tax=Arthrobacter burdickii TaxID=3035920 RepID=A0ABT8K3E9_9MICC|nr:hypothetical protein [Arthrobacter burdickii]MDN4611958.1 hypothetical protein [Arthrobacter burdickii]